MSQADALKQLKIKTNSLKRVHKELKMYESEKSKEEQRVAKLKAEMADEFDIKQAVSASARDSLRFVNNIV